MTWLSFDDGYTRERVWDDIPHDTRWHFHAIVELCCATRRYNGRLRWADALRCSDAPDPARSVKELMTAGLLLDLGAEVEVENIDDFLPPKGQRAENLLARKRKNQAEYRRRKCERGEHDRHCPAATCPARVANRVTGNPGSGRDGSGSTKTEGRVPAWLPAEFAGPGADTNGSSSAPARDSALSVIAGDGGQSANGLGGRGEVPGGRDSDRTTPAPAGVQASTPSQSLRDHDGPEPDGPDLQQISNEPSAGAKPQTVTRANGGHVCRTCLEWAEDWDPVTGRCATCQARQEAS
jgi:hypothetical protein